jgi:hypothetical protein
MDVSGGVLAQLGLKVQHALRAFTVIDPESAYEILSRKA